MNLDKRAKRLQTRTDWGQTIPETNWAIGMNEFFFYSLLAAASVGGVVSSNIFAFHGDSHATINPMSEWRNPLVEFQKMAEENPFGAAILENTVVIAGGALFLWMIGRIIFTSGSWARDRMS